MRQRSVKSTIALELVNLSAQPLGMAMGKVAGPIARAIFSSLELQINPIIGAEGENLNSQSCPLVFSHDIQIDVAFLLKYTVYAHREYMPSIERV